MSRPTASNSRIDHTALFERVRLLVACLETQRDHRDATIKRGLAELALATPIVTRRVLVFDLSEVEG